MLLFNRSELYTLVWDKPLKKIAESYRVDPTRLANMCDEYDIPRPLPGHWQKIEYGKPVERPALADDRFRLDEPVVVVRATARPPIVRKRRHRNESRFAAVRTEPTSPENKGMES